MSNILFHGGCHGCTQQEINSVEICVKCCFFLPDWDLPDLNNRPLTKEEIIRKKTRNYLIKKYNLNERI
jgi:hypothetical protein